ncbi:MAG TPA: efflux transporter outer membrane subunit [Caulobacteraceae bacterium]|jgi:NodT family efflux transporter outer membrane factor (OMF) lipoprotein
MRSRNRAAAAVSLAALLAGCAAVGPNFTSPETPKVGGYAMAGDQAPAGAELSPERRTAGPWWRDFHSARLDTVMDQAISGNRTVALAIANLDKAREQVASARGGLAPRVDANAGAERERINLQSFGLSSFPGFSNIQNPTINLFTIGATASYDFDLFGGQRRKVETAQAAAEAEAHRADAAFLTVTGNVAMAAVRIAAIHAQIDAVNEILVEDRRNLEIVERAAAAGGEARSSETGPRAQIAADEALLPPLDQELSQARHNLALLVGKAPAAWEAPDFTVADFVPPATIPVAVPSVLVRNRPDILAVEADLHADTARIGVATAALYPDLKLSAGWAQTAVSPDKLFGYGASGWNIGPTVTLPIFNGGQLRADKRAAEAQARASLAQYQETVLTAFTQVADVLSALAHDDDRLRAMAAAQTAAESALHDARLAYSLGGGPLAAVVDAQRQLDRATLDTAQAQSQKLMDVISLYAATATDWREETAKAG